MFIIWTFVHKYILVRLYAKTAQSSGWYTVDAVNNMRSCAIKSCKNYSKIVKEVSFFYFPKCPVLLEQWKIRTGCKTPNKNSSVCEKHFDIGDVRVTATRKTLRKGAILPGHTVWYIYIWCGSTEILDPLKKTNAANGAYISEGEQSWRGTN